MIRLQFVRADDIASRAIAWFSAGPYSHVDIVMPDGRLLGARSDSVGDSPPGVWVRKPNYAKWARRTVLGINVDAYQEQLWYRFARSQVSKPYDRTAIWGFALGRDWRAPDSWFCSEFGTAASETARVIPKLPTMINKVVPVCLFTIWCSVGAHILEDVHG